MKNYCACGCNNLTTIFRNKPRRFISGHNTYLNNPVDVPGVKEILREQKLGKKNPMYKTKLNQKQLEGLKFGRAWNKGIKMPLFSGSNHWNWQGGKTALTRKLRNSLEYKLWRKAVFERDNYTCVICLRKGNKLEADHIKPWSLFPELRFAIDNGRTLCHNCHLTTKTYGWRARWHTT